MNILLVTQTYGPANGPGAFTAALARGLAGRGDRVTVVTPGASLRTRSHRDGAVEIIGVRAYSLAPFYPEVRLALAPGPVLHRLISALDPDVVHIQDHFPLARATVRACARRHPVIATNHFVPENIVPHVPLIARTHRGSRMLEQLAWGMLRRVFAHAAVVTTPTETAAVRLRPHLPDRPLRVISCGVDLDRFATMPRDRSSLRAALELAPDVHVFAYVGRLDIEKRVDVLVRAVAAARRRDLALVLAGRGRETGSLVRLARSLDVTDRVRFLGFVPPARVAEVLAAADVFAMPGDVELQSIATLEAMAAGLPVLAARSGALPELVTDGVNGALFSPNDPDDAANRMAELVAAGDRRTAMGSASRARAARHDLAATVEAYRRLYRAHAG